MKMNDLILFTVLVLGLLALNRDFFFQHKKGTP